MQLSGAGALAAGTGGLAGILASGRAPAYAQTAAIALAALGRFRAGLRRAAERPRSSSNARRISASSSPSRRSTPTTSRRASPPRSSPAPAPTSSWDQQLAAALRREPRRCQRCRRGDRQGAGRLLRYLQGGRQSTASNGSPCPGAPAAACVANRKSWLARGRLRPEKFPATWEEYRAAGKKLKAKGHPFGQTPATPSATRPAFWYPVSVVVGRQGGRGRRQDRRAEQPRRRSNRSNSRSRFWKEAMDEGGLAWDDTSNNRAFLSGTHQRHQQRRLDLSSKPRRSPTPIRPRRARR